MPFRPALGLLLASVLVSAGTPAAAAVAFAVNSDDPSPRDFDALQRIDLDSGQAGKVGEVRPSEQQAPYADVEGLAMSPDGVLFGIDDATKTLLIIDPLTGRATPVDGREGNTGLPRSVNFDFGLSFDCSGQLYASSDSRRTLYRLDRQTGAASVVGSEGALGAQITGLAARYDGLYGIGSNGDENLYRIDTQTGTASIIGPLGAGLRFTDGGLDFDALGRLWGVADMTGTSVHAEPSILFEIDPATGAARRAGTTIAGVESLAIVPPVCEAQAGPALPPAIPTLGREALALLALLLGWIGVAVLRRL
jgi:hypothetical protein